MRSRCSACLRLGKRLLSLRRVLRPFSAELMHKVNGLASTRASKVEIDALDYIIVARAEVRRSPSSLHEWAMSEPQRALVVTHEAKPSAGSWRVQNPR